MQDRRKEQRWPAYLGGRAKFFQHQTTADCVIRNTSSTGAKLSVRQSHLLPDEFELIVPQRDLVYRARTRWRRFGELGVELRPAAAQTDATAPLSILERLQRAERKNAKLRQRIAELSQ